MDRTISPSLTSAGISATEPGIARSESTLLFNSFRLEPDGSLFRGEAPVHLPPRELAALRLLLAHAGQIVTPTQLRLSLWGDVHVTADSVPRCLSSLRSLLQPDDCIQTVYKRGYRMIGEVRQYDASSVGSLPRLAIPPFATEMGVPEHLGTAIAEETITRLSNARRPLASILARDSVFTLSMRGLNAQGIGEALKADLVLAGTLRALTSHFRLRVEMIRVADGIQIWVEDLLVERSKPAELELDLTSRLDFRLQSWSLDTGQRKGVDLQKARLSGRPVCETLPSKDSYPVAAADIPAPAESTPTPTASPAWNSESRSISAAASPSFENAPRQTRREAYETYLRGHYEWQTLERHRMQDGLQQLSRAIELDPTLMAAKIDLANLCATQAIYGFMSPSVSADLVRRTADSVPDLRHLGAAIMPVLGWVNFHFERDLPAALRDFRQSAHLPHDPWVTRMRSMFLLSRHRFSEAIELLGAAIEMDPYAPWLNARLAWALHLDGQAEKSVEQIEHCVQFFPDNEGTALYGSLILSYNGQQERAVTLAQGLVQRQPYFDLATAAAANALATAGQPAEARAILERLQWLSRERFVLRSFTSAVYVALGDHETALSELQAANEARNPWFFQMLADPALRPLHGDSGFQELQAVLARMEDEAQRENGPESTPAGEP